MNDTENKGRLFTIKTLKAVIIKGLFEVIKPYIKETNIMITPEYIKISTLDILANSISFIHCTPLSIDLSLKTVFLYSFMISIDCVF